MDSIIAGFERVFPELGIDTSAEMPSLERLHNISAKIAPFIKAMMDSGEYDEFEPGMVLDVYQLLPEYYTEYLYHSNCNIFYFITSETTPEERLSILKAYDTEKDYTFYKHDEELRKRCIELIEESKYIKAQCTKYNLPFYETAINRKEVFEEFLRQFSINHKLNYSTVQENYIAM